MRILIHPKRKEEVREIIESLLISSWERSRPIIPKMELDFKITPQEVYFSTVGKIFWWTPFWRGRRFTEVILFHEGHHWNIYPVDLFRSLRDLFKARKLLAEEIGFKPKKEGSLYSIDEDWSGFRYSIEEIQLVQNILADYLVNLHIHDSYPDLWEDLWEFLKREASFQKEGKRLPRDRTYDLYLAAYPHLVEGLKKPKLASLRTDELSVRIARLVREVRREKVSFPYAIKELVKLFHDYIQEDRKEGSGEGSGEGENVKCPRCGNKDWEIVAYQDKDGNWVKVS